MQSFSQEPEQLEEQEPEQPEQPEGSDSGSDSQPEKDEIVEPNNDTAKIGSIVFAVFLKKSRRDFNSSFLFDFISNYI